VTTATASKSRPFAILHDQVVVADCDPGNPYSREVLGQVAWLPSRGAYIARASSSLGLSYWTWDETLNKTTDQVTRPNDWNFTLQSLLEQIPTHIMGPSPEAEEFSRFAAQWPHVSALLGVEAKRPKKLFGCGEVRFPKSSPVLSWRSYLETHLSGDFGRLGRYDNLPLSAEEDWSLGLLSVERQNSACIQRGSGTVRSEFPLLPDDQTLWSRHTSNAKQPHVFIVTLVGNRTLIWTQQASGH
jgi:hypothetical protein